jgi:AcrR family transcriptional regulator
VELVTADSVGILGRPHKRDAVLAGALAVFARDGYVRASIDAIAAAAAVSTRTIYNHFDDKAALFDELIVLSATVVADAQIVVMNRYLEGVPSDADALEAALTAFAHAWLAPVPEHERHFDLVRQVNAELPHVPAEAVEAWQAAGPRRVVRTLAGHLRRYAKAGLITVEHPEQAAQQFAALISPFNPSLPHQRRGHTAEDAATAGIRVFLHGVLAR